MLQISDQSEQLRAPVSWSHAKRHTSYLHVGCCWGEIDTGRPFIEPPALFPQLRLSVQTKCWRFVVVAFWNCRGQQVLHDDVEIAF